MEKNINNLKWLHWFIGFTDAEGSIQVFPKKRVLKSGDISKINVGYSYHLSLHSKDTVILKDIQTKLQGIGSIYKYADKPDTRLAINDKTGLLYLIDQIFDSYPLITQSQYIRYSLLRVGIKNNVNEFKTLEQYNTYMSEQLSNIKHDLNVLYTKDIVEKFLENPYIDDWIIGFINGEGCFYLKKGKRNFYIEHSDHYSLSIIKQKLSFGPEIYKRSPRKRDENKIRKTTYILNVSSKKDISNLIKFIDNSVGLQGNKYKQFCDWK